MSYSASAAADDAAMRDGIPLDLTPLLTPYRQHRRLSLRVVHLPARAELSAGIRNEDASWSLTPEDLGGLALLLPDDVEPPPSVGVRIVVIDKNENASIVGQFEVPLPRTALTKAAGATASAAQVAEWQRRMERRAAAAQRLAARKSDRAAAEVEARWQAEAEARLAEQAQRNARDWEQKLEALRAAGADTANKLAETVQREAALTKQLEAALARAADAEAAAASGAGDAERQAAEIAAQLAATRSDWERESKARVAAAVAQAVQSAEAEAHRRLGEARASWQLESRQELDAARQRCVDAEAAARQLEDRLAQATAQWQSESEARLAGHEQSLELAWRQTLETERAAREDAEAKAAAAEQRADALSAELAATQERPAFEAAASQGSGVHQQMEDARARLMAEAESRLIAARAQWRKESDAQIAAAVQEAARKAEAMAEARLRAARESWERDSQATLAAAEGQWRIEAAKRLSAAHAEWSRNAQVKASQGRRKLRGVARRQGMSQGLRRGGRLAAVAACMVAAFALASHFKPMIVERWTPKVVALASDAKAAVLSELPWLKEAPQPAWGIVADTANVRSGPSTAAAVIAQLPRDTRVSVLERRGAWIHVRIDGAASQDGWLHRSLLSFPARHK